MQNKISNQSTEYIIRPYLYMPVAVSIATIFMAGLALYSIFHDEHWIYTTLFFCYGYYSVCANIKIMY